MQVLGPDPGKAAIPVFHLWNPKSHYCIQKGPTQWLLLVRVIHFIPSFPISLRLLILCDSRLDVPSNIIRISYEISDALPNPAVRVIIPHSRAPFVIGLIIFDEGREFKL